MCNKKSIKCSHECPNYMRLNICTILHKEDSKCKNKDDKNSNNTKKGDSNGN